MKYFFGIAMSLLMTTFLGAQTLTEDAINTSRSFYGGTARIQGLGGAQISLGGDISSASSNPAGLGFMRSSTFNFTPSINTHESEAQFFDNTIDDFRLNFNFNQLGVAFSRSIGDIPQNKFKGGTFAINVVRTNDFNSEVLYEGFNDFNSIIDFFIADREANGAYGEAAFGKLLITDFNIPGGNFNDDTRTITTSDVPGVSSIVQGFPKQTGSVINKGAEYTTNFSWGGNYDDKLYFGAGVGVKSLRIRRSESLTEDDFFIGGNFNGSDPVINSLDFQETRNIDGTGVNFNIGVIARPNDIIRFGISYVTPTYYSITEENEFSLGVDYNDYLLIDGEESFNIIDQNAERHFSEVTITEYNLRTPGKLSIGTSVFFNKFGFISGDIDFIDYGKTDINADFSTVSNNDEIRNSYNNAINYRLGGEIRLDNLRLRGGYSFAPSALRDSYRFQSRRTFSIGGGFRNSDYYVDVAYTNARSETSYSPYDAAVNSPVSSVVFNSSNVAVTLGFNF